MKIYIVKFDWSTPDEGDVELHVYDNYDEAYTKFKDIVADEHNPDYSWIGELSFKENGEPVGHYELDYDDNNSGDSEVYWRLVDEWDYNRHSFVDLIIKEVASEEIKAILTAIYCINQTNGHKDADIANLCEYAFRRFLDANTNLLTLCCLKRSKEELIPEIKQILAENTKYNEYMED